MNNKILTIQEMVIEISEELEHAERAVEDVYDSFRSLEERVAGNNAAYYRTAERLFNIATSALNEIHTWIKDMK